MFETLRRIISGLGLMIFGSLFMIAAFSDQSYPVASLFVAICGTLCIVVGLAIMIQKWE